MNPAKKSHNIFPRITNPEFIPIFALAVLPAFLYLIHQCLRYSEYEFEATWFYPLVCLWFLIGVSVPGIIHDHGGKIYVENNEWGGASFFIELPVKTGVKNIVKAG